MLGGGGGAWARLASGTGGPICPRRRFAQSIPGLQDRHRKRPELRTFWLDAPGSQGWSDEGFTHPWRFHVFELGCRPKFMLALHDEDFVPFPCE